MKKIIISILVISLMFMSAFNAQTANATPSTSMTISMNKTFSNWQDLNPIGNGTFSLNSQNSYWSNSSIELRGTEQVSLNLTANNMEYTLTNNSFFKFAWKFESNQYAYIGFILYTPTEAYWIVSYFGNMYFANGTSQGIYEFTNEQPNTWYAHTVNITALFLQTYGNIPQKITSVHLINAYFNSTGLAPSNQVSYFDNFQFYTGLKAPTSNSRLISMQNTYNQWKNINSTGTANYALTGNNTYWSNNTIKLQGTERTDLNLTANNMDFTLTNSSMFTFAWNFPVKQSDYIGFILYTPTNSYYIVSYFGPTVFANGTNQAIYEFTNEQTNTWYQHTVNLTSLFLQTYGTLPQKIVSVDLVNAHFNSTGLAPSTQVSYFDNFMFYSTIPVPSQAPVVPANSTPVLVSMVHDYTYWNNTNPIGSGSYSLSPNVTFWSNNSLELSGTERIDMNLTAQNMDYVLTNSSMFTFAWRFESTAYDYIGFILYTPTHNFYIVSYFGHTIFGNGTNQAIYEFMNEQPNTWYAHTVNLTALFLQAYGSVPQQITHIALANAYFNSTGLAPSNQVSYFDDFAFYTGPTSPLIAPITPSKSTSNPSTSTFSSTTSSAALNSSQISSLSSEYASLSTAALPLYTILFAIPVALIIKKRR